MCERRRDGGHGPHNNSGKVSSAARLSGRPTSGVPPICGSADVGRGRLAGQPNDRQSGRSQSRQGWRHSRPGRTQRWEDALVLSLGLDWKSLAITRAWRWTLATFLRRMSHDARTTRPEDDDCRRNTRTRATKESRRRRTTPMRRKEICGDLPGPRKSARPWEPASEEKRGGSGDGLPTKGFDAAGRSWARSGD